MHLNCNMRHIETKTNQNEPSLTTMSVPLIYIQVAVAVVLHSTIIRLI